MNTMFNHKVVHTYTKYQSALEQRSMCLFGGEMDLPTKAKVAESFMNEIAQMYELKWWF